MCLGDLELVSDSDLQPGSDNILVDAQFGTCLFATERVLGGRQFLMGSVSYVGSQVVCQQWCLSFVSVYISRHQQWVDSDDRLQDGLALFGDVIPGCSG